MHRFRASIGDMEAPILAEVVQLQEGLPLSDTLEEIYARDERIRLGTEALVLRLPVHMPWPRAVFENKNPFANEEIGCLLGGLPPDLTFARFSDRAMYFLASENGQHFLTGNINPAFSGDPIAASKIAQSAAIANIQHAEFGYMISRSRAVISSAPGTVFEAPSERLVRHFVRVGNIQYDRDAIDAVFFWLLPYLDRCAAILTDTWSISSIAFNSARLTRAYFGGPTRRVELLPDYIGASDGSETRARDIVERLVRESPSEVELDRVLCLISATQSGSLRERLDRILRGRMNRFAREHVAIIGLGDPGMPVLYDLSQDDRFQMIDGEDAIALSDRRIHIDPQVYFPLTFEDVPIAIRAPTARASNSVMNLLAGRGVIQVHRLVTEADKPRHHAIHFATERLLDIPQFAQIFDAALAEIERAPIFIVSSPREASRAMADRAAAMLAARALGGPIFHHETLVLGGPEGLSDEELGVRAALSAASADDEILIITDAWINDASLSQYQKSLRNEGFRGRIRYLIGLVRPDSLADWKHTSSRLEGRDQQPPHVVKAVTTIPMPDWSSDKCPWCEELRLYERWAQRTQLPDFLSARRASLAGNAAAGLSEDILLGLPHLDKMVLGPNSFYIQEDCCEAEAFAAVASTLQRLRSRPDADGPQLGPKRFPVSTVLKPTDYTTETWTDALLRGMFLRGATADELSFTDQEKEKARTKQILSLITRRSHLEHSVLLEVLLATALRKVSLVVDAELRGALVGICGGHPASREIVTYMLDQIEMDQEERKSRAIRPAAAGDHQEG